MGFFRKSKPGKKDISDQKTTRDEAASKSSGTVLRQPDKATPITREKDRGELTALEMADRRDWEVKTLPVWQPGDVILDTYEVEDVISGGMGHVYIANHKGWNVKLAIKSPNEMMLSDKSNFARILREANSWTELGLHPNIAYCYYVRNIEDVPHIFVEYVDGGNLRQWIEEGKCIDYRTNLDLAIQFCHGMEHAHSKGMIHRDIKPENILMTRDGILKITDFGLVRENKTDQASAKDTKGVTNQAMDPGLTSIGTFMGTEGYMAPEQAESAHAVDERADIFAFGVCLYEMFCGNKPYDITYGPRQEAPDPADLSGDDNFPGPLATILKKCVKQSLLDRYSSFIQIRYDLSRVYEDIYGKPNPYSKLELFGIEADGLNNKGVSYYELGRYHEAWECFEKAIEKILLHPQANWNVGNLAVLDTALQAPQFARNSIEMLREILKEVGFPKKQIERRIEIAGTNKKFIDALTINLEGDFRSNDHFAFSKSGESVNAINHKGIFRTWNKADGQLIKSFTLKESQIVSADFSKDSNFFVTAHKNGTIIVWESETGKQIAILPGDGAHIEKVAYLPDGAHVAVIEKESRIKIWQVQTGNLIIELSINAKACKAMAFSPDSKFVAFPIDNGIQMWNIESGQCFKTLTLKSPFCRVNHIVFSPDGNLVAWADEIYGSKTGEFGQATIMANTIKVWEFETGKLIAVLSGHADSINAIEFSPNSNMLASSSRDMTVNLWSIASGKTLRVYDCYSKIGKILSFSSCGNFLVIEYANGVRVCVISGPRLASPQDISEIKNKYIARNKKKIFIESLISENKYERAYSEVIKNWKESGYEHFRELFPSFEKVSKKGEVVGVEALVELYKCEGDPGSILALSYSHDGRHIAAGGLDETVKIWESNTGKLIRSLKRDMFEVSSLSFSQADDLLAFNGRNKIIIWDLKNNKHLKDIETGSHLLTKIAFSLDGSSIFANGAENSISVWDLDSGNLVQQFSGQQSQINAIAISPSGKWIASKGLTFEELMGNQKLQDCDIKIWDIESGQCIHKINCNTPSSPKENLFYLSDLHLEKEQIKNNTLNTQIDLSRLLIDMQGSKTKSERVYTISFSVDNRYLTFSNGKRIFIYDINNGQILKALKGKDYSVAFLPVHNYVASAGGNNAINIWYIKEARVVSQIAREGEKMQTVACSPNGRFLASGSNKSVRIWFIVPTIRFH